MTRDQQEEILLELSFRSPVGYPRFKADGTLIDQDAQALQAILVERGLNPTAIIESTTKHNPQTLVYNKFGKEWFVKKQLEWTGGTYDKLSLRDLNPQVKEVPINTIFPVQGGDDYWNDSSKAQAQRFKLTIDNGAPDDIEELGRKEDYNPVLVDRESRKIIDGHHRHASLKAIGCATVWVIEVDMPMPIRAASNTAVDMLHEQLLAEINATDQKELTVCLVAQLAMLYGKPMIEALVAATNKGEVSAKRLVAAAGKGANLTSIAKALATDPRNFYGIKDVKQIATLLTLLGFGAPDLYDKVVATNSIASGLAIFKRYGKVYLVRDSENFQSIKDFAAKLWKQDSAGQGDILSPDNWSPADIFVSVDDPAQITGQALKATHITVSLKGKASLNSFFSDPSKPLQKGRFVGISLKQANAQAGKATKFLTNVLALEKPVKEFANTRVVDKSVSARILFYKAFSRYYKTPNIADKKQPATKLYQKGVKVMPKGYKNPKVLEALAKLGTIGDFHTKSPKSLGAPIIKFISEVEAEAKSVAKSAGSAKAKRLIFVQARDRFVKALKASKVLVSTMTDSRELLKQMEQLSNKQPDFNLDVYLVQKIATYDFFVDIFNNWTKSTKQLKPYFQDIAEVTNPFVAVTCFAIGEAGLAPMFTKLAAEHWDDFTHDYSIDASKTAQKVQIIDNPANAGFDAKFELSFGVKQYAVKLSFRFSSSTIRIEVSDLKKL